MKFIANKVQRESFKQCEVRASNKVRFLLRKNRVLLQNNKPPATMRKHCLSAAPAEHQRSEQVFIADFHLHSKYSRATSPKMNLENMGKWAKIKGIQVLGTGDFTHPQWLKEIKQQLISAEPGLYKLKNETTRFILTAEISCIYSKNKKVYKNHILVLAPSIKIVEQINKKLNQIGNLSADGRPILGLDVRELLKIILAISQDCLVIPAHIWTPWFSVFGSKSGFNSLEDCFENELKYIYALETGLSSCPAMNWRLSQLDKYTLISNSDTHSLDKIGREANIFKTKLNYFSIIKAIKNKDPKQFLSTIEFFPEQGKYHYDGHKKCNLCLSPEETKKYQNICPKCNKPIVIGVLNRVEQIADRKKGSKPQTTIPYIKLVPLKEIIAHIMDCGFNTIKVKIEYEKLIKNFNNEFNILLLVSLSDLMDKTSLEIAQAIIDIRENKIIFRPGYDGVYGKIILNLKTKKPKQTRMFQ